MPPRGAKLFLKGDRCYKPSCPIEKRGTQPPDNMALNASWQGVGRIWPAVARKAEGKRIYFILEGQFRNYFERAAV